MSSTRPLRRPSPTRSPAPRRRRARLGALLAVALPLVGLGVPGHGPAPAAAREANVRVAANPVPWLCLPGREDPCSIPLDTTIRSFGAADRVSTPKRPRPGKRPVDCFYVYPTVTNQFSWNATPTAAPEVEAIARYQAARFSSACRVFAPLYRQMSATGGLLAAQTAKVAYRDVRAAWRDYLRRVPRKRGFVLIGHSQGTLMLRRLVREEIENRPAIRKRLVGALLIGGNVTTRHQRVRGGDFRRVPLCTRKGQAGCVVAYSSYASDPPWVSAFGNTRTDFSGWALGRVPGPDERVACVDPAVVAGTRGPFSIVIPSGRFAGGGVQWSLDQSLPGGEPTASTTWVRLPDRYVGTCRTINGSTVLRYAPEPGSRAPRQVIAGTGTHLLDVNLGLDRLVQVVQRQADTWTERRLMAQRKRAIRRQARRR